MANVTGRIEGIEELQTKLAAIGPKFDRAVRREAIRKAANVVLKEARSRVPVQSGRLKKALAVSVTTTNAGEGARIGPRKGKGRYGHLVEKGVRPHVIRVKNKKVMTEGRRVFGKVVSHPGVKARPYLEPALEAKRDEVKRVFIAEARKALNDLTV